MSVPISSASSLLHPSFASLSAGSFLSIPECPLTHLKVVGAFLCLRVAIVAPSSSYSLLTRFLPPPPLDMSRGTSKPPQISSAVFAVSTSIIISASPEKVWKILLDFDSYKQWNPFVRSQSIVNNPNSTPLAVGHHLLLSAIHLPPTMDDANVGFFQKHSSLEEVTVLDHENRRVALRFSSMIPRWMLDAERLQMITVEEAGGETKCKYESYEEFKGILAYVVRWYVGKELKLAFDAMAKGLKERAEQT
ncbi:hypothetical protein GYMLUDRAFT_70951 [Collybiopsis luxurians FD-317 M1]|nr:hypothetical protein GYMLUDRAFT_70951 [Collybiopsis luxurians FD-317 M1]